MKYRDETRKERYEKKRASAKTYPISIACVNFMHDGNLGYLIRAASCFGAQHLHVIGNVPSRKLLNPPSGGLYDYVEIMQYKDPGEFLLYAKHQCINIVAAEIDQAAVPLHEYVFDFRRPTCIFVGHEQSGVPATVMISSDVVQIPMPGVGYCLNTAQTANILMYEAVRQYDSFVRESSP